MAKRKVAVRLEGADPAQIIMPGVRPVSLGERLNWQAQLPMQPRRVQKPLAPIRRECADTLTLAAAATRLAYRVGRNRR